MTHYEILRNFVLPFCIGVASSIATRAFSEFLNERVYKREHLKEKYENFYLPFVNLYNKNIFGATDFTDLSKELQKSFYDLVVEYEYRYRDPKTYDLIYCFKGAHNIIYSPNFDEIMTIEEYNRDLNYNFNNLVIHIFELQEEARKKLKY